MIFSELIVRSISKSVLVDMGNGKVDESYQKQTSIQCCYYPLIYFSDVLELIINQVSVRFVSKLKKRYFS